MLVFGGIGCRWSHKEAIDGRVFRATGDNNCEKMMEMVMERW